MSQLSFMQAHRPRRMRQSALVREMVAETRLSKDMFIMPHFVIPGNNVTEAVEAMPGVNRYSIDSLLRTIESDLKHGINKIMLFGVGDEKSDDAQSAHNCESLVPQSIKLLKAAFGKDLFIVADLCVCSYTTHGHCGILHNGNVDNKATVKLLTQIANCYAETGVDMLAPSDMMDGRVAAIRSSLDENQFEHVAIMSHATKFASSYYGPFREAADCAPQSGDRKSYQMDFRNPQEALREALLDADEGADVLMVKPGLAYLDIISLLRKNTGLPLAVYNVSGEYSMVKAAAKNGWIDEQKVVMETMFAFARAGASLITSYHTNDIFKNNWL